MSIMGLEKLIRRNSHIFSLYNDKRKALFKEIAPKESTQILYLLPWLLSVNHKKCPGYLPDFKGEFKIFGLESVPWMKKKEKLFKKKFKVEDLRQPYGQSREICVIDGVYTIGSIGTLAHTAYSDCDIWVCVDFEKLGNKNRRFLTQKINLIKDWYDENCRIPIYFFISDIDNIKKGYFGKVDNVSSGSAQKNILIEEFYRTTIVIAGKIPFWWLCVDSGESLDYESTFASVEKSLGGGSEYADFGALPPVNPEEYLGASLWQLQKAFASPLKSVIKMALLKRQIDDPGRRLAADLFRQKVLLSKSEDFVEPMTFTMELLIHSFDTGVKPERLSFLKECFFLRCNINVSEKNPLKKKLVSSFLKSSKIPKTVVRDLQNFKNWDMSSQIKLGKRLVQELFSFYKTIASQGKASLHINLRDLTVLGRKITSIYQKKNGKVNLIPKPAAQFNLLDITYVYENNNWKVFAGNDRSFPLFSGRHIVKAAAFAVWNDLFKVGRVRMEPNRTSVSLQEIVNLSFKLKDFIGKCDVLDNSPLFYLKKEKIQKVLIVVSFEEVHYEKNINNFAIIYKTTWGELFVKRIESPYALQSELKKIKKDNSDFQIEFYLQRNSSYYEKIIRRTRVIIERSFGF
ncbi:MAG: class I adenylate cyclase [Desulforegulaceae bacterium]|nr:class I adenylate cyclase [Desulforegulaceae bacterium]